MFTVTKYVNGIVYFVVCKKCPALLSCRLLFYAYVWVTWPSVDAFGLRVTMTSARMGTWTPE